MRKIVQIAEGNYGVFDSDGGTLYSSTTALCDDGSLWCFENRCWNRLPDIPQEAAHED